MCVIHSTVCVVAPTEPALGSCRYDKRLQRRGRGFEFRLGKGFWVLGLLESFILHDPPNVVFNDSLANMSTEPERIEQNSMLCK